MIPADLPTGLAGGTFCYTERRPAKGDHADLDNFQLERDTESVTIDLASGKELTRTPYRSTSASKPDPMQVCRVPSYLHAAFARPDAPPWPEAKDIAREFLALRGIDTGAIRKACRTEDGNHMLILAGDTLHYCDLRTRATRSWPAPTAWRGAISLEFHAISSR